jgi:hypothetical protein
MEWLNRLRQHIASVIWTREDEPASPAPALPAGTLVPAGALEESRAQVRSLEQLAKRYWIWRGKDVATIAQLVAVRDALQERVEVLERDLARIRAKANRPRKARR